LIRLGWYLSPIGVWLGVFGICILVWRVNRQTAVMLAVTLFFTLFYLWRIRNNPHQIYTMRRYVPATLPLFILATAYGLNALREMSRWPKLMPAAAYLLAILWLLGLGWSARGFISQVDYAGVPEQMAALNGRLQPHSILLFNQQAAITAGDIWGTPLQFFYGHDVFSLRYPEAVPAAELVKTIENWHNNGRTVYWLGDTQWLVDQNLPFTTEEMIVITTSHLEDTYEHKPTAVLPVEWHQQLSRIEPNQK
jgi:hypothetical protein